MATTPVSITSQVFFKKRFIYQSQAKPILPPPVASSQWFQEWSTPVRQRIIPALAVALAASGGVFPVPVPTVTPVAVETVTGDVIYPRSFIYQSKTQPTFVPAAPTVPTFFNLTQGDTGLFFQKTIIYQVNTDPIGVTAPFVYGPWSEPVRRKGPIVALQQAYFSANFTPPVTPVTDVKWSYPWSEPVRTRRMPVADMAPSQIQALQPPTILVSQWYEPWVDPVRLKPGLSARLHQTLAWSNFTPAVVVADIRWFEPWVDPVRVKRGLLAGLQHFYSSQITPPPVLISQWNYAWSEPVRQKPGLQTRLQQFTSLAVPPQPNFVRTINWYQPYSLPVWPKKGLRVAYQSAFTAGTPVIKTQVTLTMSAFEINLDQFLAGVIVSDEPPPPLPAAVVAANVSIEEIPLVSGAATSIEET